MHLARLVALALFLAFTFGGCACNTALLEGVLVADGDTLGTRAPDGSVAHVRWASGLFGYNVRRTSDGLVLTDIFSQVVAREGDRIQVGGGTGADNVFNACGSVNVVADDP